MTQSEAIDVSSYLRGLDVTKIKKIDHEIIDRLCKKIDVTRTVKRFYLADLSKAVSDEVLPIQDVNLLTNFFIEYYKKYSDYKVLNTLLKITDGILLSKNGFVADDKLRKDIQKLAK